jgi:sterol 3beta-glucosyltransferase
LGWYDVYINFPAAQLRNSDTRLASSIHVIHRPLARSRRGTSELLRETRSKPYSPIGEEGSDIEYIAHYEEEPEDFELPALLPSEVQSLRPQLATPTPPAQVGVGGRRPSVARAGTSATVKLQRRAQLADKLREIFELDDIKEVLAGM